MDINGADRVYDSIINGQMKQAVQQLTEIGLSEAPEILDYFSLDLEQPEVALKLCKAYFISL